MPYGQSCQALVGLCAPRAQLSGIGKGSVPHGQSCQALVGLCAPRAQLSGIGKGSVPHGQSCQALVGLCVSCHMGKAALAPPEKACHHSADPRRLKLFGENSSWKFSQFNSVSQAVSRDRRDKETERAHSSGGC